MRSAIILAGTFVWAFALGASGALAQSCPSHAHVTSTTLEGNVKTIHCGCDDSYVNYNGRCHLKSDVKARLVHRAAVALQSAAQTAKSMAYEAEGMGLKDFFGTSKDMAESLILLPSMLSVDPAQQAPAAAIVLARVTAILATVAQCEGGEAIKTGCENLANFLKIAHDSLEQAAKL